MCSLSNRCWASSKPADYERLDQLFIGGRWWGGSAKPSTDHDTYSGEAIAEMQQAGLDDLEAAYAAAKAAQPRSAAASRHQARPSADNGQPGQAR